jgi:hypothetical protein
MQKTELDSLHLTSVALLFNIVSCKEKLGNCANLIESAIIKSEKIIQQIVSNRRGVIHGCKTARISLLKELNSLGLNAKKHDNLINLLILVEKRVDQMINCNSLTDKFILIEQVHHILSLIGAYYESSENFQVS